MRQAHYEVGKQNDPRNLHESRGSLESDFDDACTSAREISADLEGVYEVRFMGHTTDPTFGLLVAAYKGGELLDTRTPAKVAEDRSRI